MDGDYGAMPQAELRSCESTIDLTNPMIDLTNPTVDLINIALRHSTPRHCSIYKLSAGSLIASGPRNGCRYCNSPEIRVDLDLHSAARQTEGVCRSAVRRSFTALKWVRKQNLNICMLAVKTNGYAISFVNDSIMAKHGSLLWAAAAANDAGVLSLLHARNITKEIYVAALTHNHLALKYVFDPTYEMCLCSAQINGASLGHIPVEHRSPELVNAAIHSNPVAAIKYISHQTVNMCVLSFELDKRAMIHIRLQQHLTVCFKWCVASTAMALGALDLSTSLLAEVGREVLLATLWPMRRMIREPFVVGALNAVDIWACCYGARHQKIYKRKYSRIE